jgi:hypothetical protein
VETYTEEAPVQRRAGMETLVWRRAAMEANAEEGLRGGGLGVEDRRRARTERQGGAAAKECQCGGCPEGMGRLAGGAAVEEQRWGGAAGWEELSSI